MAWIAAVLVGAFVWFFVILSSGSPV